jgi:hypothetical protein
MTKSQDPPGIFRLLRRRLIPEKRPGGLSPPGRGRMANLAKRSRRVKKLFLILQKKDRREMFRSVKSGPYSRKAEYRPDVAACLLQGEPVAPPGGTFKPETPCG